MKTIEYRREKSRDHTALLFACQLLASRTGEEELATDLAAIPDQLLTSSVRELLAEIIEIASRCGLQLRISRPAQRQLFDPAFRLPLLAELHDQRTLLVETVHRDPAGVVTALTIQIPAPGETVLLERMTRDEFLLLWNGTTLRFERFNSALTCCALFASSTRSFSRSILLLSHYAQTS
jgi:hypothetical protein